MALDPHSAMLAANRAMALIKVGRSAAPTNTKLASLAFCSGFPHDIASYHPLSSTSVCKLLHPPLPLPPPLLPSRYAAAEVDCSLAVSLDVTYSKAFFRRGLARAQLGRVTEAMEGDQPPCATHPTSPHHTTHHPTTLHTTPPHYTPHYTIPPHYTPHHTPLRPLQHHTTHHPAPHNTTPYTTLPLTPPHHTMYMCNAQPQATD